QASQVDRAGRPRERKAGFTHIHVQLFLEALAHAVDGNLDGRFEIARKRRQELLFERSRLSPILEADESGIRIDQPLAGPVNERDGSRLEPIDSKLGT